MTRSTAVLDRPVETDDDVSEAPHRIASAPRPRASRGSGGASIDLLLIHSPTTFPLPPAFVCGRCGIVSGGIRRPVVCMTCRQRDTFYRAARWEYAGRIYHDIPLELIYASDEDDRSRPDFQRMDSLMRAKPYRGAA